MIVHCMSSLDDKRNIRRINLEKVVAYEPVELKYDYSAIVFIFGKDFCFWWVYETKEERDEDLERVDRIANACSDTYYKRNKEC